jgi:cation diffusion facilitator family transporter
MLENIKFQKIILVAGLALFALKLAAYFVTHSVAILTDALESTVNVATGIWGLYSLQLAAAPGDKNHPYGHGKVEFITATIEGLLIALAGVFVIIEALSRYGHHSMPNSLDLGMVLVGLSAIFNYWLGYRAIKQGQKNHSLQLQSTGKHLQSDSYTTVGLVLGLALIRITGWPFLDVAIAIILSVMLIVTGYKIIRQSISGIMDEADISLLNEAITHFNSQRRANWVDLHNLRIIKYGHKLHFDCHLTVPWFFNVNQAHDETAALEQSIRERFGDRIELFVHTDGCMPFSCKICAKENCAERQQPLQQYLEWTYQNLSDNVKHGA